MTPAQLDPPAETATPSPSAKLQPPRRVLQVEIGFRTMLLAGVALALFVTLVVLWPILITVVVGLMILGMLAPAVAWLEAKGLRRGWAIAAVVPGIGVSTASTLLVLVPRLAAQISEMMSHLPDAQRALAEKLDTFPALAPLSDAVRGARSSALLASAGKALFAHSAAIAEVIAYGVSAFFIALYLMIDRDRMPGVAVQIAETQLAADERTKSD